MATTAELVLLAGVFALLAVSLVLLLVLGAQAFTEFDQLGSSLSNAFDSVLATLEGVTNSVLQSLQSFANTAVTLFETVATTLGTSFLSIAKFIRNELSSAISSVTQSAIALAAQVTRTLTGGLIGAASNAVALLQGLQYLFLQATQVVAGALVSATSFIFSALSAGLSWLIRLIFGVLTCTIAPIICALNCLRIVFGIVFCIVCNFCCVLQAIPSIPFVFGGFNCPFDDIDGASCCGNPGCGGCGPDQFNICNHLNAPWPPLPLGNTPCIFGQVINCPSYCTATFP